MVKTRYFFLVLLAVLGMISCTPVIQDRCTPAAKEEGYVVYLISQGWHTGIVFNLNEVDTTLLPPGTDFSNFRFVELGWGDRQYYMADGKGVGLTLRAALLPTESVLHVVQFNQDVPIYFHNVSRIERVRLRRSALDRAWKLAVSTFELQEGRAVELGEGLYGKSRFFAALGDFTLLRNCNVWVGTVLEEAGCPIVGSRSLTEGLLMNQAQRIGDSASH